MYGGRPEYYQGRPNHGLSNGRYPFDFGFMPGKGLPSDYDTPYLGRYPPQHRNTDYDDGSDTYNLKQPEEEEVDFKMVPDHYGPECDETCAKGEFICHKSCKCIPAAKR